MMDHLNMDMNDIQKTFRQNSFNTNYWIFLIHPQVAAVIKHLSCCHIMLLARGLCVWGAHKKLQ